MLDLFNWRAGLGDTFAVRVTSRAAANRVKIERQADDSILVRVYVVRAPEGGKANQQMLALLAKELGVAKSRLSIVRGATSRNKRIHVVR